MKEKKSRRVLKLVGGGAEKGQRGTVENDQLKKRRVREMGSEIAKEESCLQIMIK